ncbi:MAG: DUF4440 domain-containing protein [Gaiellaceae bacterium MAG52_C11]|nr:DUF4440 domain-containing protein [Candidatus Gaiellasilicea maunaloa]
MVREIGELTGALVSAVARGDAGAAGATYGDDGRLIASSAEVIDGRSGIEAYWQTGISLGLVGLELRTLHLDASSDAAVEIGHYELTVRSDLGYAVSERSAFLTVYRRRGDGSCCGAVDVFNAGPPRNGERSRR